MFTLNKLLARTGLVRFTRAGKQLGKAEARQLKYLSDRSLALPMAAFRDPILAAGPVPADVLNLNLPAPVFDSPVGGWRFSADRQGNPQPWGLPALREQVVAHLQQQQRTLALEHVFITHGASGAYAAVLDSFINPGDRVVCFDPCSPLFTAGAVSRRAKVQRVPLWHEDGRSRFTFDALAKAMRGARLLVLSQPNNPTGGCLSGEDCESIAWLAKRHDVLVFLDETQSRYQYESSQVHLANCPGMEGRLFCGNSITQGYGLGSLRVGWLTGPEFLVRVCVANRLLSTPYVPTACQQAALRAIQGGAELFQPTLEQFQGKRQYCFDRLQGMKLHPTWPRAGYFMLVDVSTLGLSGEIFARELLKQQQVLVGPGASFGASSTGAVRVSFAVDDGRLREGMNRLEQFVSECRGAPRVVTERLSIPVPDPTPNTATTDTVPDTPGIVTPGRLPQFSRV